MKADELAVRQLEHWREVEAEYGDMFARWESSRQVEREAGELEVGAVPEKAERILKGALR